MLLSQTLTFGEDVVEIEQFPAIEGFRVYAKVAELIVPAIKALQAGRYMTALCTIFDSADTDEEIGELSSILLSRTKLCVSGATPVPFPLNEFVQSHSYDSFANVLAAVLLFNFACLWGDRFTPEDSSNNASTSCPYTRRINTAFNQFSLPPVVYSLLTAEQPLTTFEQLKHSQSVEDAMDMLEIVQLDNYIANQRMKKAETESR